MTIIDALKIQIAIEEKKRVVQKHLDDVLTKILQVFLKKIDAVISAKNFCFWSVSLVVLLSVFLRSKLDIGHDSGFYLSMAQDFASGGKYYDDFFESNFPLTFWLHLIPYHIAKITGFSMMIVAECYVNILAVISLYCSYKILQKCDLSQGQMNVMITAYAAGFFLRIGTLEYNEFLTKTSFYLIFAFPYIAYSFHRNLSFSTLDKIYRGLLAGLLPCLKPHYIILPLIIELCRFWRSKDVRFFFELDKLIMVAVGFCYVVYMIYATPQFFIYMVPMWSSIYNGFAGDGFTLNLVLQLFDNIILITLFVLLVHKECFKQDDILLQVLIAISLIVILEGLYAALDQHVCFIAIATMIAAKMLYDFFSDYKAQMKRYYFLLASVFVIAVFDEKLAFLKSLIMYFWIISLPILSVLFYRKMVKHAVIQQKMSVFVILILVLLGLSAFGIYLSTVNNHYFIALSFGVFFVFLMVHELVYAKYFKHVSGLFVFIFFTLSVSILSSYIANVSRAYHVSGFFGSPDSYSDQLHDYSNRYLTKPDDQILFIMEYLPDAFPAVNYLHFDYNNKVRTEYLFSNINQEPHASSSQEESRQFTISYLLENLKSELKNRHNKIIALSTAGVQTVKLDRCTIGFLEYYFQDQEFKKLFLEHYQYLDHFIYSKISEKDSDIEFFAQEQSGFESLKMRSQYFRHHMEFYIRKDSYEQ